MAATVGGSFAFVGRGDPPHDSGSEVDALTLTANYHLISTGRAYPTYYRCRFPDLRNAHCRGSAARDRGLDICLMIDGVG